MGNFSIALSGLQANSVALKTIGNNLANLNTTGGAPKGFAVDSNGIVTATYGNGQSGSIGQIAVATVANTAGLVASGNNNFITRAAPGLASIGVAGSGGGAR